MQRKNFQLLGTFLLTILHHVFPIDLKTSMQTVTLSFYEILWIFFLLVCLDIHTSTNTTGVHTEIHSE